MPQDREHGSHFNKIKKSFESLYRSFAERLRLMSSECATNKILVVAISRKGPHLMREICEFMREDSRFAYLLEKVECVSDFALPFIDVTNYDDIVIMDDAIYYGTTFRKVQMQTAVAYFQRGGARGRYNQVSMPLVISDNPEYELLKPFDVVAGKPYLSDINRFFMISKPDTPYYINSVIDIIGKDHHSYDIESPTFRIEYSDNEISHEEVVKKVYTNLCDRFGNLPKPYCTKRFNRFVNRTDEVYTIVLDSIIPLSFTSLTPDFVILKFFFNRSGVNIVSYCYNTINENLLRRGEFFPKNISQSLWKIIVDTLDDEHPGGDFSLIHDLKSLYGENACLDESTNVKEYKVLECRSLSMLANFIISYYLFRDVEDNVMAAFPLNAECTLSQDNLVSLVGNSLCAKLVRGFEEEDYNVLGDNVGPLSLYPSVPSTYPSAFKRSFEDNLSVYIKNLFSHTKRENHPNVLMSVLFGSMHQYVELPSRQQNTDFYNRLLIGESYNSLCARMRYELDEYDFSETLINIHKGLDSRIDAGSVVPFYAQQRDFDGETQWVRLYRSGENEDSMSGQLLRTFLYVVSTYLKVTKEKVIDRRTIDFLILIVDSLTDFSLFGIDLQRQYSLANFSNTALVPLSGIKEYSENLVEIAKSYQVIKEIAFDNYSINDDAFTRELLSGNLFSIDEETAIEKAIRSVYELVNFAQSEDVDFAELLNWLYFSDDDLTHALSECTNKIQLFVDQISAANNVDYDEYEDVKRSIQILFYSIPEPYTYIKPLLSSNAIMAAKIGDIYESKISRIDSLISKIIVLCFIDNVVSVKLGWIKDEDMWIDAMFGLENYECAIQLPAFLSGIGSDTFKVRDYINEYSRISDCLYGKLWPMKLSWLNKALLSIRTAD